MLIEAHDLRKVYRIHEHQATTLKEMALTGLFQKPRLREHIALDGITFRLDRGGSLGVIGPNGSGKSTLLKLIAGIIEPTSGRVEVHGRVASLLELGAGFQPEFTGMENIFLQGRILGLSRAEILERLDRILDFSGLGDFIHTPIKRYSTGMIVRLGFSIAAHFDADLLLIDEVLAVGDGAFQSKCLERIESLRRKGAALLFVSHDMGQVERVADEVLWLDHGHTRLMGPMEDVLQAHEKEIQATVLAQGPATGLDRLSAALMATVRQGTGEIRIRAVEVLREDGRPARRFPSNEPIHVAFDLEVLEPQPEIECWFGLGRPEGTKVALNNSGQEALAPAIPPVTWKGLPKGVHRVVAVLDPNTLPPGHYMITCSVNRAHEQWTFFDMHLRMYRFRVVDPAEETPRPERAPARPTTPQIPPPLAERGTPAPLLITPVEWEES